MQVGDETEFVPTNESQSLDEPTNVASSTEVAEIEVLTIVNGTAGREDFVGELQRCVYYRGMSPNRLDRICRRLETAYMRQNTPGSFIPGSPESPRGTGLAHKQEEAVQDDPTAQGAAGPDRSNGSMVAGLPDSPRIINRRSQKCEGDLEGEIPDQDPLPAEQKAAPAITSLTGPRPSFSESVPDDPQGLKILFSSQAYENSSSPVAGSTPVLVSSPLPATIGSQPSSPAPRVSSPLSSSPIMVSSSPMTSSPPVSSPLSSFVLAASEDAIPELLLTEPGERILGVDSLLDGDPATGSEALISPGCLMIPSEVKPEPSEADKIQKVCNPNLCF